MRNCRIKIRHHFDSDIETHELPTEIFRLRRNRIGKDGARLIVGVNRHAGLAQASQHRGQQSLGRGFHHEQRFEGVAHARPLHLGVVHDIDCPIEVGGLIEHEVHDPGPGFDNGNLRFHDDGVDQIGRTTRNENVDETAGRHQAACPLATKLIDCLNGGRGKTHGGQRVLDDGHERAIAVLGSGATTKHNGVTALERQGRDIDGHIGASLVDGSHNAERNPNLGEVHAIGHVHAAHNVTNRVCQRGHLTNGIRQAGNARGSECQAVHEPLRSAVGASVVKVERVGRNDVFNLGIEGVSNGVKARVLGIGVERRQDNGGRLRRLELVGKRCELL